MGAGDEQNKKLHCWVLLAMIFLSVFITFVVVIGDAHSHPGPIPTFTLNDVKLYAFNVSTATSTLTSNLQITIFCQNTDHRTCLHLDKIELYAYYRNIQITRPTTIPLTYIDHDDATVWYPYLNGTAIVMNPNLLALLGQDLTIGKVLINVKGTGWLTNYQGYYVTARYEVKVNCPAYVAVNGNKTEGNVFDDGCYTSKGSVRTMLTK